jgi:hypothetical protein
MRGLALRIAAALAAWAPLRNLILWKVRRDAGIPQLPDLTTGAGTDKAR